MDVSPAGQTDVNHTFVAPAYRVCFWKQSPPKRGATAWWYELSGLLNVRQAMAWADENVGADRTYALYAVIEMPVAGKTRKEVATERVMVRLFGIDQSDIPATEPRWPTEIYAE